MMPGPMVLWLCSYSFVLIVLTLVRGGVAWALVLPQMPNPMMRAPGTMYDPMAGIPGEVVVAERMEAPSSASYFPWETLAGRGSKKTIANLNRSFSLEANLFGH